MNFNSRTAASRTKQAGFTLIELMIVVAIGLILIAIAIGLVGKAREEQRIAEAQTSLMLVSNTAQSLSGGGNFVGITAEVMCNSGKLSSPLCDTSNGTPTLRHPFGGAIEVKAGQLTSSSGTPSFSEVTGTTGTANSVQLKLVGLSRSACSSLAGNVQNGFIAVETDTGTIRGINAAAATPGTISEMCVGDAPSLTVYAGAASMVAGT